MSWYRLYDVGPWIGRHVRLIAATISVLAALAGLALLVSSPVSPSINAGVVPPAPRPVISPTPTAVQPQTAVVTSTSGAPPLSISIPALGITNEPVLSEQVSSSGVLGVPSSIDDAGWWANGPAPGSSSGTVVIDGHVDGRNAADKPVEGAFFHLSTIPLGSEIDVTTGAGVVRYEVVARRRYPKAQLPAAAIFVDNGAPQLVLITCGGAFSSTGPDAGHYADNDVVWARLIAH